ncbi:hypothetical protein [Acetobacter lambici]|uniref:Hemolysin XhlA n=1 Tax=Acetobacter lambici TaxID=1332824 RepID=A0ABT1F474_9PROT|nr:hypothetical protein [Acetobacter lambici]MCP1243014.1 hypothetical protein [Acetobacter lambici]MCP1258524.1 hypothetical protein [Acetobacter lambici]
MSASLSDMRNEWHEARERKGLPPSKEVEKPTGGGDNGGMDDLKERVAVLEQIAKDTKESLKDIKSDVSGIRADMKSDFRWILGIGIAAFGSLAGLILKVLASLPAHP